jgi:hypothetical protein
MGRAIGLEIRKVYGVKMTNEEKIALEAANKIKQDMASLKTEKEEEDMPMKEEEPTSSASGSSSTMKQQITV